MAMQMRYLQALAEVASEKNSTIIFPLPLELLAPFLKTGRDGASAAQPENAPITGSVSLPAGESNASREVPAALAANGR